MLVLSRKENESVMIGDDVELVIVEIRPEIKKVRLGFNAPRNVAIHRKEVWLAINEESAAIIAEREALTGNPDEL